MSTAPLPSEIDIRKLVVKDVEISGQPPISSLPRIADMLAGNGGSIKVDLRFFKDEERFRRVDGRLVGSVSMTCQRCLEPMTIAVETEFKLAIVWSEEDAQRLPSWLEPLIVGDELVNLADIVSEELILSLPFVSYHEPADCKQQVGFVSVDPAAVKAVVEDTKENPFQVLQNLKLDK
ncbi:MAG: hypothetical protein ACJAYG_002519 [Oceanicoccus sp.]|jgi:uncharacterized protein